MDCVFQDHKLSQMCFDVPSAGFVKAVLGQPAYVRKYKDQNMVHPSSEYIEIISPMQIVWTYDTSMRQAGFVRKLQQEITKPLNIHLSMTKMPGFNYRLRQKENVVISRLLVVTRDIDEAIDLLIDEANRFYILYCHTL